MLSTRICWGSVAPTQLEKAMRKFWRQHCIGRAAQCQPWQWHSQAPEWTAFKNQSITASHQWNPSQWGETCNKELFLFFRDKKDEFSTTETSSWWVRAQMLPAAVTSGNTNIYCRLPPSLSILMHYKNRSSLKTIVQEKLLQINFQEKNVNKNPCVI